MSKTDPRKLVCTACKHENEVERVYCHNCGEKLDRSLLPQLDETQTSDAMAKSARKMKRQMNPNRFAWVRSVKTFVLIEIFAAVVAAVFLVIQAPENVPPAKNSISTPIFEEEWAGMMGTAVGTSPTFTEFDINSYFRTAVKGEGTLGTKFVRAFVGLQPGLVTMTMQREAFGLPLYYGATFQPILADGKWKANMSHLSFGRLAIPAAFAKMTKLDTLPLDALAKRFEKEIKQLDRVEKIQVGDKVITFFTKSAR